MQFYIHIEGDKQHAYVIARTQTPAIFDNADDAMRLCECLNEAHALLGFQEKYVVSVCGQLMYDRVKEMTKDEMKRFIYWIYAQGNQDGKNGLCRRIDGFFGEAILECFASELEHKWKPDEFPLDEKI